MRSPSRPARADCTSLSWPSASDPATRSWCPSRRGSRPPPRSTTSARRRSSSMSNPTRGARRSTQCEPCSPPGQGDHRSSICTAGFPDLVAFEALAAEHDIALIEDAAEAAGGWHAGRAAGSFGRVSTFSFHGSKTLTTGEGGMVLCDDERSARTDAVPTRPWPPTWRRVVPQRRGRVEVQDERAAGRARACPARPHRGADREEAPDLRLVRGPTRGPPLELNVERPGERATFWMVTAVFDEATA